MKHRPIRRHSLSLRLPEAVGLNGANHFINFKPHLRSLPGPVHSPNSFPSTVDIKRLRALGMLFQPFYSGYVVILNLCTISSAALVTWRLFEVYLRELLQEGTAEKWAWRWHSKHHSKRDNDHDPQCISIMIRKVNKLTSSRHTPQSSSLCHFPTVATHDNGKIMPVISLAKELVNLRHNYTTLLDIRITKDLVSSCHQHHLPNLCRSSLVQALRMPFKHHTHSSRA